MHGTRPMRVVAQNLWARFGDWPRRREALRDGLRRADPHLAAFVEAVKTDDYDQVEDLLGPGYEVVYEPRRDRQGIGVALARRWPGRRGPPREPLAGPARPRAGAARDRPDGAPGRLHARRRDRRAGSDRA